MCTPLIIGGIAIAGVGTALSASAAKGRGAYAKSIADRNARMAEIQAADSVSRALLPAVRARMRGGQVIGVEEAHYGASGVLVGVGSPGDVTLQTRIFSNLDEEVIRTNAALEAFGYRTKAQAYRQEGEYAEAQVKNEVFASVIGGVGRMLAIGAKGAMDVSNPPEETDFNDQGI